MNGFKLLFGFVLLFLAGCEMDHGIEPIRSNVQGVVKFTGEWPGTAAEVRLVAATQFPPASIGDLIIGETIPANLPEVAYTFYLKPGNYGVFGIAWREQGGTWDIASICGLYFSGTDSLTPGEIVLSGSSAEIKGIDIRVNRSKARKVTQSRIHGKLRFSGAWPDSISEIRVIASAAPFSIFPSLKLPTLLDLSFSGQIAAYVDSADYSISAFPANYYATGIIFFRQNHSLSSDDLMFSLQKGGMNFTRYEVLADSSVHGPDFKISF
jgi:hypothetical protein